MPFFTMNDLLGGRCSTRTFSRTDTRPRRRLGFFMGRHCPSRASLNSGTINHFPDTHVIALARAVQGLIAPSLRDAGARGGAGHHIVRSRATWSSASSLVRPQTVADVTVSHTLNLPLNPFELAFIPVLARTPTYLRTAIGQERGAKPGIRKEEGKNDRRPPRTIRVGTRRPAHTKAENSWKLPDLTAGNGLDQLECNPELGDQRVSVVFASTRRPFTTSSAIHAQPPGRSNEQVRQSKFSLQIVEQVQNLVLNQHVPVETASSRTITRG